MATIRIRSPRGGLSDLVNANLRRQRVGAAAQVATARADLVILDGAAPRHLLVAGLARLAHPNDSLAQLGARLGVTKDVVMGRLRRLHQLAERRRRAAT